MKDRKFLKWKFHCCVIKDLKVKLYYDAIQSRDEIVYKVKNKFDENFAKKT